MSVFTEFRIPAEDFELGRALGVGMDGGQVVQLETMVPIGDQTVPYFRVSNEHRDEFVEAVRDHPSVRALTEMDVLDGQTLFSFEWETGLDELLEGVLAHDAQVLNARSEGESWVFEFRFPTHERLRAFREYCEDTGIALDILRLYNPGAPHHDGESYYGLTPRQYEALTLAVEWGYYRVPRQCSTSELADELGISAQAVSERLRRAVGALVTNTLFEFESD